MTFTPPQLARAFTVEKFHKKTWDGWFMEPKHDGMRAIVHVTDEGVEIWSRSGKPYAQLLPKLVEVFKVLPAGTILDGELAIIDGHFPLHYIHADAYATSSTIPIVNFNKTMRIMGTGVEKAIKRQDPASGEDKDNPYLGDMTFICFDILAFAGKEVASHTQRMRSLYVSQLVKQLGSKALVQNPTLPVDIWIYDELVAAGIEGVILKNQEGIYKEGRNSDWLKLKSEKTFDVVVMGFTDANEGKTGKWLGKIGAIEFGAYLPDGTLQYVGRCSGMDDTTRDYWTQVRKDVTEAGYTPANFDPVVIEVKANELVGSGEYRTPRHPQYVGIRIDKEAKDCTMDQFS